MIFAYNKAHVGDCLMVICANDKNMEQTVERKGNVAQIKTVDGPLWVIISLKFLLIYL